MRSGFLLMKQVNKSVLIMIIIASLTFAAFIATTCSADWIEFHANNCNTGVGTGDINGPPRLLWNYSAEAISGCGYSPIIADGVLYEFVGNGNANLLAINASTGEKIWNHTFSKTCSWSPAIADGILYFGCYDQNFYALDASTGTQIWNYSVDSSAPDSSIICSSPTVSNGVVYAGYGQGGSPNGGALIAINCTTGCKIWNYSVPSYVLTIPAVENGIVYAGMFGFEESPGENKNYEVFALNSSTGALLWTFHDETARFTSSPTVANGLVYICSLGSYTSSKIYALDAQSGGFVWSHELEYQTSSSPAIANNLVYVGSGNGSIYAFDALSDTQIWSYKTGGAVISSPAISNGVVCIGSSDGYLYAFDATTGANLWKFAANGRISASPAISNGKIYFISDNSTTSFPEGSSGKSTIYALDATPQTKPDLTLSCASTTAYNSFHVTITGTLTENGDGLSAAPIQIAFSIDGGTTWESLTQALTDANGAFLVTWYPSASGNYIVNATYNGDSSHSTVNTTVNLAVTPYQSENANVVFSVASNSTVTDLSFNSESRQLSFSVNGPSGTTGYTDICIPKSLINDISTLTISVDNNQASYTYTSTQDSWIIHFSYSHSTHTVTIDLGINQQNPTPTPTSNPSTKQTTTTSKQTPTPTANPSTTPTVPEFPTVVILPLLVAIPLLAAVLRKNKCIKTSLQ